MASSVATITTGKVRSASVNADHRMPLVPNVAVGSRSRKNPLNSGIVAARYTASVTTPSHAPSASQPNTACLGWAGRPGTGTLRVCRNAAAATARSSAIAPSPQLHDTPAHIGSFAPVNAAPPSTNAPSV